MAGNRHLDYFTRAAQGVGSLPTFATLPAAPALPCACYPHNVQSYIKHAERSLHEAVVFAARLLNITVYHCHISPCTHLLDLVAIGYGDSRLNLLQT